MSKKILFIAFNVLIIAMILTNLALIALVLTNQIDWEPPGRHRNEAPTMPTFIPLPRPTPQAPMLTPDPPKQRRI